jgi:toxin ParE1/3/4
VSLPVRRTRAAESDIDDIWFHIAADSVAAADRLVDRIDRAEQRLGAQPAMGPARPDLANGLRHWPLPPYLILYRIEPDCVLVVRVLHGARDLPALFGG